MTPIVSSPQAPDPVQTAAAQSGANRDTAISSQLLNMTNQVGPDGNLTYNQTGSNSYVDSLTGKTVSIPQFTATTTLSPQQQAIKEQTDAASLNLGKLANQQSAAIGDRLSKPFEFNNNDASNWAYDLASQRILPQQQQNQDKLRTQLIASGIRPGTASWDSEMSRLTNANTDQLNQLALNGRNQAFQEQFTQYNNPINTIGALMSGSQVQNPQFVNTPQTNVAGVDYTGLVNQKHQADVARSQATAGGLFGLGAGLLKAIPFSDVRLKKDIQETGKMIAGLPAYMFRYVWEDKSSPLHTGFMAQDVEKLYPNAVHEDESGFKRVDYSAIGGNS